MMEEAAREYRAIKFYSTLTGALAFALAALLVSVPTFLRVFDNDWQLMILTAPLAAFLVGGLCWHLLLLTGKEITVKKGLLIGLVVGLISHPLAWYIFCLINYFMGSTDSLGQPTVNPLDAIWASLVFSAVSLLFLGPVTGLVGATVGGLLAFTAKRKLSS